MTLFVDLVHHHAEAVQKFVGEVCLFLSEVFQSLLVVFLDLVAALVQVLIGILGLLFREDIGLNVFLELGGVGFQFGLKWTF